MIIGVLTVELSIDQAFSLKDKRSVLTRVCEKVRQKFNVAISEVEENDVWNRAVLGVVTVANQKTFVNRVLSKVIEFMQQSRDCVVEDFTTEFL